MFALAVRTLVGLLALAFAASGVAAHYCNAAHHASGGVASPATAISSHHFNHDGVGAFHNHHALPEQGPDHQHVGVDADPFGAGDLACDKCCGMCTLTHAVVSPSVPHIMFRMSAMEFAANSDLVFGALPWIDPGIPKRIA